MATDAEVLATRCQTLEERVRKLENYWSITIGLAIILGIGGSWIGTRLSNTQARLDQIQSDSAKLVSSLQEAKTDAIENINKTGKEAASNLAGQIKTETQTQVATILSTGLAERDSRQQAVDSAQSHWIQYIYQQAAASPDTKNGANGWWQTALINQNAAVQLQLK